MYVIGLPTSLLLLLLLKLDLHRDGPRGKDGVRRSVPIIATGRRSCVRGGGRHGNIIVISLTVVTDVTHVHGTRKEEVVVVVVVGMAGSLVWRAGGEVATAAAAAVPPVGMRVWSRSVIVLALAIEKTILMSSQEQASARTHKKGAIHSTPNWAVPFSWLP